MRQTTLYIVGGLNKREVQRVSDSNVLGDHRRVSVMHGCRSSGAQTTQADRWMQLRPPSYTAPANDVLRYLIIRNEKKTRARSRGLSTDSTTTTHVDELSHSQK